MSVNLLHTIVTDSNEDNTRAERDWAAITAITGTGDVAGLLPVADATIDAIAHLVEDVALSNGETVTAYPREAEDEWGYQSYVPAFGLSLLDAGTLAQVRGLLEQDEGAEKALTLFDLIVERRLEVRFNGTDHCFARMVAVNWPADEVEINRCSGNMSRMFQTLGLGNTEREHGSELIALPVFAAAVEARGIYTDMPERLEAFVACAQRQGSTHVYWA